MQKAKFVVLAAMASLAACVHQPQVRPPVQIAWEFDQKAAEDQLGDGSNTLTGSAFMRQQGGGVVTCAGAEVALIPETKYANDRLSKLYGAPVFQGSTTVRTATDAILYGEPKFDPDPPAYRNLMRRTTCDAQGNFTFDRVKSGAYYLVTRVLWSVGHSQQGGFLATMVNVSDGRVTKVIMSR